MYRTKIDQVVSAHLRERGITPAMFAAEIGISNGTLQRIRSGKDMSFDTAFLMACRLGISMDDLYAITH